jgi:hypothetical protein
MLSFVEVIEMYVVGVRDKLTRFGEQRATGTISPVNCSNSTGSSHIPLVFFFFSRNGAGGSRVN